MHGFIQDRVSTIADRLRYGVRVDSSCPVAISSPDEPEYEQREESLTCGDDPQSFAVCAENRGNQNIARCFEGCTFRNG